ncbi:hypothetical protein Pcinc_026428 [Petrolisthes cinctipes]|uniref:Uncharacterized protein n=1 Tax=Petrolisthes cinctipes TaxID=88211 RepID=A0AAE1F6I4_PETCI|nr:hypothetical protein Pcinc_026428 [Petrolisthes cinctipes]
MSRPKKSDQEVAPHSPTTTPVAPTVQTQAVGEFHDIILKMLQLFRDECEQKRQPATPSPCRRPRPQCLCLCPKLQLSQFKHFHRTLCCRLLRSGDNSGRTRSDGGHL